MNYFYLRVFPTSLLFVLFSLFLPAMGDDASAAGPPSPANLRILGSAASNDFPLNTWVKISPTPEHITSQFGYEGGGSFDPYERQWIHQGGHDVYSVVQGFATWKWDIDNGGWEIAFVPDGPPGT